MDLKKTSTIRIRKGLLPFSFIYGLGVKFRNLLFNINIFKRQSFDIPIICIGNISVGGTGKTPHSEYLINLLQSNGFRVALLSRGYKRKTSGFLLATSDNTALDIGDEPFQIKQKYPETYVAVDANRVRGINKLLKLELPPDVIIMDDGLQHRYVFPSYSILLTSYNSPYYEDKLLPAGRLREKLTIKETIDDFIITKCPDEIKPLDLRLFEHKVNPYPFQDVFFTNFNYHALVSVFGKQTMPIKDLTQKQILLVTGIANPLVLVNKLREYTSFPVKSYTFPDHYQFVQRDVNNIVQKYNEIQGDKILIFTEKDATRLLHLSKLDDTIINNSFYIPIDVHFIVDNQEELFKTKILNHVRTYTKDS